VAILSGKSYAPGHPPKAIQPARGRPRIADEVDAQSKQQMPRFMATDDAKKTAKAN
jgi:hypothetical protein